jgi:20S proteasome alpha/beta subunit
LGWNKKGKITCDNNHWNLCKDGILIGSDSRTTYPDNTVRDTAKKVRFVEMQNQTYAMVAYSGDDDLGTRVADSIETVAKPATLKDWQMVSEIGDRAISKETHKLKIPFEGPAFKMEEFQNILRGFDSTFMIAHFYDEIPYIFTADFYPGRFSRRNQSSYSIGCGSPIANFLLDGFDFSNLEIGKAAAVLIYVIEEVKKFDPRCGGPTRIFWSKINKFVKVSYEGKPEIKPHSLIQNGYLHDDTIKDYISEVSDLRKTIKGEWTKKLQEIVSKSFQKEIKRRTTPERFIRMRHGAPLDTAAAEYAKQTKNQELAKLVSEFRYGQANEMPKAEMEIIWRKICNLIPSKPELVEMGADYFKRF